MLPAFDDEMTKKYLKARAKGFLLKKLRKSDTSKGAEIESGLIVAVSRQDRRNF
jgi:hypothetical protein